MRYLLAIVPFALVATRSAQTPAAPATMIVGGQPPATPPWDAPHLEFDVASVKVNKSGPTMMSMRPVPGTFNMTNIPLRLLLMQAYRISNYQLVGAPNWIDSERFDIIAKTPGGRSARPDDADAARSAG